MASRGLVLAMTVVFLACSPTRYIDLDSDRYQPSFQRDLSAYAGRSVYLTDLVDEAPESLGDHFGAEQYPTWYGDTAYYPSLTSYFWYVFEKALRTAGMNVSGPGDPDLSAPQLKFAIVSVTEAKYRFRAELARYGRVLLVKDYEASLPVPHGQERTEPVLESRADRMVDELIQKVLGDPEFEKAFLGSGPPK